MKGSTPLPLAASTVWATLFCAVARKSAPSLGVSPRLAQPSEGRAAQRSSLKATQRHSPCCWARVGRGQKPLRTTAFLRSRTLGGKSKWVHCVVSSPTIRKVSQATVGPSVSQCSHASCVSPVQALARCFWAKLTEKSPRKNSHECVSCPAAWHDRRNVSAVTVGCMGSLCGLMGPGGNKAVSSAQVSP